jgi:hypothetical protein
VAELLHLAVSRGVDKEVELAYLDELAKDAGLGFGITEMTEDMATFEKRKGLILDDLAVSMVSFDSSYAYVDNLALFVRQKGFLVYARVLCSKGTKYGSSPVLVYP